MKTRLILTACASALLLGLPAAAFAEGAAPAVTTAAQGGVAVPPLGFNKRVLANGMEVYTARDASTSNVTVQVWYRVGSKDDPAGRSGFAHLFEHLLFKATKNMPSETFDRLTEDVGGMNNAFTADDVTAYYEVVPANHLQRILFAEADRMGSLVVDEATFVSERDVVKEEYRQRILASPYGRLFGLFTPETIYQDHPYRRPGIGSIEELNASTLDDVLRFHATYYRPDNAMLIVAGNFDQAQLDAWVNEYFAPLKRPATPMPLNNVKEPEPTGPRTATYYAPNVPLPAVVLAWNTVAYRDADRAALTVLDGVLSTGESSRLYRSLIYDKQIAASIGSNPDFAQQAGNLTAYAIMADGQTVDAGKAALEAEIARLRDAPVTAAELSEAKNELVANALRGRESIDDRATTLGMALIMTGEQGKPLAEARGEVAYAAGFLEWFAEEARRVNGDVLTPHAADKRLTVLRRPVGVVAAITPWNFPLAMITRKAGPALAVGCAMVLKPSELTPLSALALAKLAEEAGVPPGVFNVITGEAAPIGEVLTGDPRVRKFTFTGSTAVGKMLAARCMATVKRVSLELGGNAPFIVFDDADIEAAVEGAVASKFRNTGQTCVCANRFFIQAGIHDRFASALAERVGGLRLGAGLTGEFDQGPLIDVRAVAKVRAHIADAVEGGARILTGGQSAVVGALFFQPTVLVGVRLDALVNREETFGPLAAITRFETESEAVRMANDTSTGLAAYVFTKDMSRGVRLSEALECGMVGLNTGLISTEIAPFGGVKESGMGREGSRYGLEDYLDLKLVCAKIDLN